MGMFGDFIQAIASPVIAPFQAAGNLVGDVVNGKGDIGTDFLNLAASPIKGPVDAWSKAIKGTAPQAPSLLSPSALSSTPTQAQAADTAAATNLSNEQAAAAQGGVPSTAALLSDRESYKSTSTLLGA